MNTQKLFQAFNTPDTQLVISAWPERTSGKKGYHGDAAFTRETLLTLTKRHNMRFVVIAEVNGDNRPQIVDKGRILILRVIDHGKFHLYPTILTWLAKFPAIKQVTVHSNFTYSGLKHFVLLIPFLALIKLTGRKITHVAHNVVDSIDFLARQLNTTNPLIIKILNMGIRMYNTFLGYVTDHLVALDAHGFAILKSYVPQQKLVYNPHWVKPRTTHWTKKAAKKALGIDPKTKVLMSFGFVSWYKGSDLLAKSFSTYFGNNSQYQLIFAGGKSPSMNHQPHYQKFYMQFLNSVNKHKNIQVTGFIPDNQLGLYFAATDIAILPYRGLMGGSGALAHVIGYEKPFLLSSDMKTIWENEDMDQALKNAGLTRNDVTIDFATLGMKEAIKKTNNLSQLRKMVHLAKRIKEVRHIDRMTDQLYNDVYAKKQTGYSMISSAAYAPKKNTS